MLTLFNENLEIVAPQCTPLFKLGLNFSVQRNVVRRHLIENGYTLEQIKTLARLIAERQKKEIEKYYAQNAESEKCLPWLLEKANLPNLSIWNLIDRKGFKFFFLFELKHSMKRTIELRDCFAIFYLIVIEKIFNHVFELTDIHDKKFARKVGEVFDLYNEAVVLYNKIAYSSEENKIALELERYKLVASGGEVKLLKKLQIANNKILEISEEQLEELTKTQRNRINAANQKHKNQYEELKQVVRKLYSEKDSWKSDSQAAMWIENCIKDKHPQLHSKLRGEEKKEQYLNG